MRILCAVFVFVCCAVSGFCSGVLSEAPKTVVFLYTDRDGAPEHAQGTGFLIATPVSTSSAWQWVYLVTAKHVLETDDPADPMYSQIYARMNLRSGGSEMVSLPLRYAGPSQTVFLDSEVSVDVAVVAWPSTREASKYDALVMDEGWLAVPEDLRSQKIGVGSEVFFTGMFVPFQGQQRNYPIVRFGRVAMMPDEKVPNNQLAFDAYFVETFAFGGNSGSPVFFYSSTEDRPVMLAGVMKGYFVDLEPVLSAKSIADTKSASMSQNNSGIAIVVPAEHIRRILHSGTIEQSRLAWKQIPSGHVQ